MRVVFSVVMIVHAFMHSMGFAKGVEPFAPEQLKLPISKPMGPYRLATHGEARYAAPDGAYAYLELEVLEVSTEWAPSDEVAR
jgi:hypothetical protein